METNKLRIYRETLEFMNLLHKYIRNMPRFEKYIIGDKMLNHSLDLVEYIARANRDEKERAYWLTEFLVIFESIKALLNISVDKHLITLNMLEKLLPKIQSIEKQATAWKKSATLKSRIEDK